ncbi:MAG: Two-component serine/threonine-protein kinase with sensor, partial [Actinomycetota bacterium]
MTTSPDQLLGAVLDGRYRLDSILAKGGMATVFIAADLRLKRQVAVKVMHASLAEDADFVRRFEHEARAAASLTHQHVVSVHDQGNDAANNAIYLVMELVPGHTIRDLLSDRGPLTAIQALAVMDPVLQALSAAHEAGFVHRDIKPENIIIGDNGRIKVTDFGLARAITTTQSMATTRGMLIGTVAYLSPEQVEQGKADERSDIYSAGVVLYEMLTGKLPHAGDTPIAVAFAHVHADIPKPSSVDTRVPTEMDYLVLRSTARDPRRRFN